MLAEHRRERLRDRRRDAERKVDNLRDRRTILSSFSLALLGPAFFIGLMSFVLTSAIGESDEPVEVAVVGGQYAPDLMRYLEAENTTITRIELSELPFISTSPGS